MAKRFSRVVESDADVETVFGVLAGRDWAAQRAAHLDDDSRLLSYDERPDGGVTLVISRALPSGIPGFLQKFLPADPRATTTDVWGPSVDGVRRATWTAEITGAPATLRGTMTIEPTRTGNRHTIEGEVKVPVPLVGGKAESYIAEKVGHLADLEAGVVRDVLA